MLVRALAIVLGLVALVGAIASAIHAAALPIAITIVLVGLLAFLWWIDYPSDKKKPP